VTTRSPQLRTLTASLHVDSTTQLLTTQTRLLTTDC